MIENTHDVAAHRSRKRAKAKADARRDRAERRSQANPHVLLYRDERARLAERQAPVLARVRDVLAAIDAADAPARARRSAAGKLGGRPANA